MLRPGDILNNKYEILDLIGEGGMSTVWLATDRVVKRLWAVKDISKKDPKYKLTVNEQKTLSEINIMRKLNHPSLPRIVDVIDEEDDIFVVMDYIEGENLESLLNKYGVQKETVVVSWMLEVCDILTYLHSQNPPIIYRDIKPSNLMLDKDGHIKIIDFGIAREFSGKADTMPLGTQGYASPEHFTKHTDERSDVFTVGATAYQLLTGKDPQEAPYTIQPLRQVNPNLSQGLEKIILKATRQNPDERYQTARELANAFESYTKLDDEYIGALQYKLDKHRLKLILSVIMIVVGIAVTAAGFIVDRHNYQSIIQNPGGSVQSKEENLTRAIEINPKREEAYISLIEAYAEDGKFTEDESDRFFAIYNAHSSSISGETSYDIGEAYLRYYTGTTDGSARAKLLTAEPFFTTALDSDYKEKAESYVFLASCYRNYVMSDDSLLTKDITKDDLSELLTSGAKAVESQDNDKLRQILAEAVLNLIEQEKIDFRDTGIPESEVQEAIRIVSSESGAEIASLGKTTEESVRRAYENGRKEKKS